MGLIARLSVSRYNATFGIAAVVALLVTPIVLERRTTALRNQITAVAEPARRDVSRIRLSFAMEVAAVRGYVITGDERMLGEYREARTAERRAFHHLIPFTARLGTTVHAAAGDTRQASERWNAVSERVARGEMSREMFVTRLFGQQQLYRSALESSVVLEDLIAAFEAQKRSAIQRAERVGIVIIVMLTLLAAASAGLFFRVASSLKAQTSLARTDALTGLLNRRGFLESITLELQRASRLDAAVTLIYLDIDDFKSVNDSQGHAAGDQLLRDFAASIGQAIRKTDTAARLGGDEFAILLLETADAPVTSYAAGRIRDDIVRELSSRGWSVTLSAGAISAPPGSTETAELIAAADDQMYSVKRDGKSSLRWRSLGPPIGNAVS